MVQVYCFSSILSIKMLLKASVSPALSEVVCCCYLLLGLLLVDLDDGDDNVDENNTVKVGEHVIEGKCFSRSVFSSLARVPCIGRKDALLASVR